MNINSLDLNLLKVFDALYQSRNVSRAGEHIGIAQSSMSHALNRLREQFDDPLFQRTPKGMEPTARAQQLAPQIQQLLHHISVMIEPVVFDPALAQARITIATTDLMVTTLAPLLMARLNALAPGIQLNFMPLDKQQVFNQLDNDQLHLALGTFSQIPARFHRSSINEEHFICIARQQHPQIKQRLTLKLYCQLQHVLMTLNADQSGVIDRELKRLGKTRHIAMTCAQFSPISEIVANSNLISTIPAAMAGVAQRSGCKVYPLPFIADSWETELISSQHFRSSPLGAFMVQLIADCGHAGGSV